MAVKVRFKLAWQNYRVGDEIEPPGVLRDWLLRNGYVERVDAQEVPALLKLTSPAATRLKRGR